MRDSLTLLDVHRFITSVALFAGSALGAAGARAQSAVGTFPAAPAPASSSQSPAPAAAPPESKPASPAAVAVEPVRTQGLEPSATSRASTSDTWAVRFARAREKLSSGQFDEAAHDLQALAQSASDRANQAVALELASLANEWARRDLAFVRRQDLGDSSLSAKALNRRTSDEIAVLYTNGVFYGLGAGLWVAVHAEPDSAAGVVLPALGFAGAAAGAIALADSRNAFGYGVPQSIVSGMYIGLEEGLTWTLWNQARVGSGDEWDPSTVADVILGFSSAGAVAGGVVGSLGGTTPGRASWVGSTALWSSLVFGFGVAALSSEDNKQDDKALLASALGLNAGAVFGAVAAGPVSPSIARVRFLDLGGIAGALLFGGLYVAAADRSTDARGTFGAVALGTSAGLGVAWFATRGMPRDDTRLAPPRSSALALRPTWIPLHKGAAIGIAGQL